MTFRTKTCVEVVCDGGCDDPWEEGTPHFDSTDEAAEIVRSYGWVIVGDRALCRGCAEKATCAITGHVYGDWTDTERLGVAYRYRLCENCCGWDHDPPWEQLMVLSKAAEVVENATTEGEQ